MNCTKCGRENNAGSKFCRFCGNKLGTKNHVHIKISPGLIIFLVIIIVVGIGIAFAFPKAKDYFDVQNILSQTQKLESSGNYSDALKMIGTAQGKWMTSSLQDEVTKKQQDEQKYVGWQNNYNTALADIASSSYDDAQTALQGIDPSYPQYSLVKDKLVEVDKDIQDALNAKVVAAQQTAATQQAAAAAAQRQAQAAANSAASAAQTAKSTEILKSFYNQLNTMYQTYVTTGNHYYIQGTNDVNSGDTTSAAIDLTAANTAFGNVETDAKNLNTNFSNLPQSYSDAANNMEMAAYYSLEAIGSILSGIQNSTDTSATTLYYANLSDSYSNQVKEFLSN